MNFKELLYRARQGDEDAILEIFEMYRPLLIESTKPPAMLGRMV